MRRAVLLVLFLAACGPSRAQVAPPASASVPPLREPALHDRALAPVLSAVRPERLEADVARLVSFGTRHTLSDTTSPTRGIGAARTWIAGELGRVPAVKVSPESHLGARLDARVAVSKDDVLFGVRAYDRDGWRSPVTFAKTK